MRSASWARLLLGLCFAALASAGKSHAGPIGFSVSATSPHKLYRIDLEAGLTKAIGPIGPEVEGLAFDPVTGSLFGVQESGNRLIRIDSERGAVAPIGALDTVVGDMGLAFDGDGALWMSAETPTKLFSVDPASGAATSVGNTVFAITGLASSGDDLFGLRSDAVLLEVDVSTGSVSQIGDLGLDGAFEGGLAFDADGVLWGLMTSDNTSSQIVRIDTASGSADVVHTVPLPFHGLAIARSTTEEPPPRVPEPGALILFLTGAALMSLDRGRGRLRSLLGEGSFGPSRRRRRAGQRPLLEPGQTASARQAEADQGG